MTEKVCRWSPIEAGSNTFQPGCCRELWDREQGCELYDHCQHCGGRIEEVPDESNSPSAQETPRELTPSEAASFAKTLSRSPRRVDQPENGKGDGE